MTNPMVGILKKCLEHIIKPIANIYFRNNSNFS